MTRLAAIAAALILTASTTAVDAREILAGPYAARVLRVVDGDTFLARIRTWLYQDTTVYVRLLGVDTPERGDKARCAEERRLAEAATARLEVLLSAGSIELRQIQGDKYAKRIDAQVYAAGVDVVGAMIESGHGRPYAGRARKPWCGERG